MSSEHTPETVQELNSAMTGRWLVTTGGSKHIWDLDARTYTRLPGPGRRNSMYDNFPQPIWAVKVWPKLGESFYVELDATFSQIQWRQSTEVRRIERLADDYDDVDYDPELFTDGDGAVWCQVTITMPDGEIRTAVGGYLHATDNFPKLMCGIFDLCEALELPEPSDAVCLAVSAKVDPQLSRRPWATLRCPEIQATLMLTPPPWGWQ